MDSEHREPNITPNRHWGRFSTLAFCLVALTLGLAACQGSDFMAYYYSPTPTHTQEPSATPSPSVTFSPTETATATPSPEPTQTETPTFTIAPASETPSPVPSDTETITPGPSPTASRSPTITQTPTRTRKPSMTPSITLTRTPSPTPTITNTPTPPLAFLRLERPGPFSQVASPFTVAAVVSPGDNGWVNLDLIGEDNRVISHMPLDYRTSTGRRFRIAPSMQFQISGAVETARLVMSIDDLFGRKIALSSVDLILMQVGDSEVFLPESLSEPYLVRAPRPNSVFSGGMVTVSGLARPVNNRPLILELIDEGGKVVGSMEIIVPPPTGDLSHTPFEVGIPYQVNTTTPVRLTLRQESAERIPGTVALSSLLILLEP